MTALRIVYAGTPEFAVPALQALLTSGHQVVAVYTQPDRPAGRGRILTASPVKQYALSHHVAVEQPVNFRDPETVNRFRGYQADVMVVAAYGLILPQMVLDIPRYGCINIHASLLPRWRGAAPIQRAILAGDTQSGVTLMRMEAGLDTGAMLKISTIDIDEHESAAQLQDRLAAISAPMLLQLLEDLPASLQQAAVQPEAGVTYAKKILKEEAHIDWHHSAIHIDRLIRAFNPWPVAETLLNGQQLRIWQAQVNDQPANATPGTVVNADANGIQVACADRILNVTRLQQAGRKAMSAAEFIRAHTAIGQRLGE
jgi:methionyl-tRNA formyltransferase